MLKTLDDLQNRTIADGGAHQSILTARRKTRIARVRRRKTPSQTSLAATAIKKATKQGTVINEKHMRKSW